MDTDKSTFIYRDGMTADKRWWNEQYRKWNKGRKEQK